MKEDNKILMQFFKEKNHPLLNVNLNKVSSLRLLGSVAHSNNILKASSLLQTSSSSNYHAKLGAYAAELYKDKSMTDVMVVVQSKEFKAHKAVLACHSPYFKEVLNKPGFVDVHYLQIPSVTAKAFEILLDYIYTGELKVTCQELSEVHRAAKKLGVQGAIAKCFELLQVTNENYQNMVYLYVTARKLNMLDASARGFKLMVLNFEKLILTREFLELEIEQIIELFSVDKIGARSEIIVFMAALKWLDYDFLEREDHVERIFDCVRFPLMSMQEILACYHPPLLPGLMTKSNIRETLMKATCYIAAKSLGQEALFSELAGKSRTFLFGGEPMVLWDVSVFDADKYKETKEIHAATIIQAVFRGYITRKRLMKEIYMANYAATVIQSVYRGYRVRKSMKRTKTAMQKRGRSSKNYLLGTDNRSGTLKAFAKTTFETLKQDADIEKSVVMYAMGAFDTEKPKETNSLLEFDTTKKSWKILTKCIKPRHDARMVYLDGYLYVIGGFNPLHRTETGIMLPLRECHRYYIEGNEWRILPDMNVARSSHVAAVFNNQILAIGGKNDQNKILSSIEKYDVTSGKWKDFSPSLPESCMAVGCTTHKGVLWIAGGITTGGGGFFIMDSVWCLDNETCLWSKKVNLPQAVAFPSLMSDGSRLFCIGGASRPMAHGKEELESIDKIYEFANGRWIEQLSMPYQCHSVIGCNVGNLLHLFGGYRSHTMSHLRSPVFIDLDEERTEKLTLPKEANGFIVEATVALQ